MSAKDPLKTKDSDNGVWNLSELEDKASELMQWAMVRPGAFKAAAYTRKLMSPGVYIITKDNNDDQPVFFKKDVATDEPVMNLGSLPSQIIGEVKDFWTRHQAFKDNGFLHRRGFMLYGKQGTGKSSIVQQVMADTVKSGGVVFLCGNPYFFSAGLKVFRQVEPDRQVVCVFEDIDAIIKKYGEDEILAILDGANQIDRVLNIATTNYPELLDKRIVSRPRRFDRVYKIGEPDDSIRTKYLKHKLPKSENLKKWVEKTKGLSFAGMTEAIISVLCLGNGMDESIEILRGLENGHPSSEDFGSIGFGAAGSSNSIDD